MGHEFSGRVLEVGPDGGGPSEGTMVTSVPIMVTETGIQNLAYTNLFPCGYSERMLLSSLLAIEVPNGLEPRHAALDRADGGRPARRQPVGHHHR